MLKDPLLVTSVDWKSKREELKAKRKPLFTWYAKNPNHIRMALELKHIDDQIAECTERMELPNRAGLRSRATC
jgi:hypothetical protein